MSTTIAGPDPNLYSEALEQQWALARDMMVPSGYWLAGVNPNTLAQLQAVGKGAPDMARYVAAHVAHAHPFFWAASIARAIVAASQTMPAYTFTTESFPCPRGFVWFEQPVQLPTGRDDLVPLRAVFWSVLDQRRDPEGIPVLVKAYAAAEPRRAGVPIVQVTIRLGWTLQQLLDRSAAEEMTRPDSDMARARLAVSTTFYRFLAGCLSFLEQRIVHSVERQASRAVRRRLEREQPSSQPASAVRVIELRRHDYTPTERDDEDASPAHDWHWQWVVSGHWRRQYYPKSNAHKPRYIAPYVKGPADKPLKAPAGSVFAVTR